MLRLRAARRAFAVIRGRARPRDARPPPPRDARRPEPRDARAALGDLQAYDKGPYWNGHGAPLVASLLASVAFVVFALREARETTRQDVLEMAEWLQVEEEDVDELLHSRNVFERKFPNGMSQKDVLKELGLDPERNARLGILLHQAINEDRRGVRSAQWLSFVAMAMHESADVRHELYFRIFDRDRMGEVTRDDLAYTLLALDEGGWLPSDVRLQRVGWFSRETRELSIDEFADMLMYRFDRDRDGSLSYEDFCAMLPSIGNNVMPSVLGNFASVG